MQYVSQQAVQRLEQKMSQTQLQSLDILSLSSIELTERIFKEITENPVLEITKEPLYTKKTPETHPLHRTLSSYRNERIRYTGTAALTSRDNFNTFLENLPDSHNTSLQNHLLAQLHIENISPELTALAEKIIENLNENGFHRIPLNELFEKELKQSPQIHQSIRKACTIIRRLEPIGCAVQNFKESLFVQAALLFYEKTKTDSIYAYTLDILKNHFSYLEKARPYSLAQAVNSDKTIPYKINTETAEHILKLIGTLEPFPGRAYTSAPTEYIIPTAFIEQEDGELNIKINSGELPIISIANEFTELAKKSHDTELKEYLKPHIQKAKIFIGSLNQREKTIINVLTVLITKQKQFFLTGDKKTLIPLTQHDIAKELDIHESTVSRTVSNKYLQCEWGTFEIKYFFAAAPSTQTEKNTAGTEYTKEAIKELINEIIHTTEKKLSDQTISDTLKKTYNIKIARRTVNKYRKELKNS